jgi:pyruvate,water dikinase
VISNHKQHCLEHYHLKETGTVITSGRSIGQRIGQGHARLLTHPNDMAQLKAGDILVTDMTNPDWEPVMKKAAAIITNRGGRTCHAAIIARELGIPAIVGCGNATAAIKDGQAITVSCADSETGYVYDGLLAFDVEKTQISKLPALPLKLCINLANPEQAFTYQFLPNDGVGLARLEFIIGNMIGIHPNALLCYETLPLTLQNQIREKTAGYASPVEFYIEKLAEGIATIAAAFYPKPIIVRFSDFKSNEYANLLGGRDFEPQEENPMLGYRGGSRYNRGNFRECFLLECEAIKRVRNKTGLTNTHIMFQFVRTVTEAKQLIDIITAQGLERGKDGLQVYMMCEIPSNAILAKEFLDYFDGFSIGSNDLTQLTLGLDRDSAVIADLFDENDPAVKALLHNVITTCKKLNKYVGICGQGPSDHIEFAQWLMDEGIMSISLTPDSIVKTWLALAKLNSSCLA